MNNISNSFADYLEEKGYLCPVCYENFEINPPDLIKVPKQFNKQPTQLSCQQHNICIACFEAHRNNFKLCPVCRAPLTFSASDPKPNSQVISAIEAVKNLWEQLNPSVGNDNSLYTVSKKPALKPFNMEINQLLPQSFECLSLAEAHWQHKNVGDEIAALLPSIVEGMQWKEVAQELLKDFQTTAKQWVLLVNQINQESLGIACLKSDNHMQWESHWTGVKENNLELYLELYKHLLAAVEKRKRNDGSDWRNLSLTTFFNYDTEEKWFNHILSALQAHNIRYEIVYLHRKFPNNFELHQAKLTTFPCKKEGHIQKPLILDNQKRLESDMPFEEYAKPVVTLYLEKLGLNLLFRFWASEVPNQEAASYEIKQAFLKEPQNFFVYTIQGRAKGFMWFRRNNGNLEITSCKLLADSHKYADHFIQNFIVWATTKPIYAKGTCAKKVKFSCPLTSSLRNAIEKNIEKIEL